MATDIADFTAVPIVSSTYPKEKGWPITPAVGFWKKNLNNRYTETCSRFIPLQSLKHTPDEETSIASCYSSESAFDSSPDDRVRDLTAVSPSENLFLFEKQMLTITLIMMLPVCTTYWNTEPWVTFTLFVGKLLSNYSNISAVLWESLPQHLDKLPEESKSLDQLIQSETIWFSNMGRYTLGRSMASVIILRRLSWLQMMTLPLKMQCKVEDLPFRVLILLSQSTGMLLLIMKKNNQLDPWVCCLLLHFTRRQPGFVL